MFYRKLFWIFSFKIDCITLDPDPDLDPDPNWAKILDPDPKFNVFGSTRLVEETVNDYNNLVCYLLYCSWLDWEQWYCTRARNVQGNICPAKDPGQNIYLLDCRFNAVMILHYFWYCYNSTHVSEETKHIRQSITKFVNLRKRDSKMTKP